MSEEQEHQSQEQSQTQAHTETGEQRADAGHSAEAVSKDQLDEFLDEKLSKWRDGLFGAVRGEVKKALKDSIPAREESKPAPEPKRPTSSQKEDPTADLRRELEQLKQENAFKDAISELGLSRKQRETLWKLYRVDQPDELSEWAAEQAKDLGFQRAQEDPKPQASEEPKVSSEKPRSDAGSVASTSAEETSNDVLRWTKADFERFMEREAEVPGDWRDVRNRPAMKKLRRMVEGRMKDTRVTLPRPGDR